MKKSVKYLGALLTLSLIVSACSLLGGEKKTKGFNLFPLQKDIQLGAQVAAQIDADTQTYPLLDSATNVEAYKYLYDMRDKLLNSGNVAHKNDFAWRLRIIKDDNTLNAFCTPGGYIYVYTGLMKYLDSEDQLAGVLGHEIAHADLRHSTRQMTKSFGVELLLSAVLGKSEALKQVTSGIIGLKFSRSHESEADEASVNYLCPTDYNAAGGAGFFEKIEADGGARQPEFLSTHPNPANRIEHFKSVKVELGCTGDKNFKTEYQRIIGLLPS